MLKLCRLLRLNFTLNTTLSNIVWNTKTTLAKYSVKNRLKLPNSLPLPPPKKNVERFVQNGKAK